MRAIPVVQRALNDARMRLQAALKEKERADSVAARWASEVADRQNETESQMVGGGRVGRATHSTHTTDTINEG
jgi:hypothetical protein